MHTDINFYTNSEHDDDILKPFAEKLQAKI